MMLNKWKNLQYTFLCHKQSNKQHLGLADTLIGVSQWVPSQSVMAEFIFVNFITETRRVSSDNLDRSNPNVLKWYATVMLAV